MSYPLFLNGIEVGRVLAPHLDSSPRITPIEIDPRVLLPTPPEENPNRMSDDAFSGLVDSIAKLDFSQTPAIATLENSEPRIAEDGWHLEGSFFVVDGEHRRRGSCLLDLQRIPCCWYRRLRPGEAKVLRIALNRHRGHPDTNVEQQLLREAVTLGWSHAELLVAGYGSEDLERLLAASADSPLDLGSVDGTEAPPSLPDDETAATTKAAILEIAIADTATLKTIKRAFARFAKACNAPKGEFRLQAVLLHLLKVADPNQ